MDAGRAAALLASCPHIACTVQAQHRDNTGTTPAQHGAGNEVGLHPIARGTMAGNDASRLLPCHRRGGRPGATTGTGKINDKKVLTRSWPLSILRRITTEKLA